MRASFYIVRNYLRSKSKQNVINIINRITIWVLIVGGASLMVVLSGFAGLKSFSLSFSSFFDPDLKILPKTGKTFSLSPEQISALEKNSGIISFSKVLEEKVFLSHDQKHYIAYIKGVDANYARVNAMDSILSVNPDTLLLNDTYAIAGDYIARSLNLGLFSSQTPLKMIVPKAGEGSITRNAKPYRERTMLLSDYYRITEDLDGKYVFTSLKVAQELLGLADSEISAVELKIRPAEKKQILAYLEKNFGEDFQVKDRMQMNEDLYRMFNVENLITYLIFTLVLVVALFNLVGAIIMMILDKRQDLKTLYAMGMTPTQLKNIFFLQGICISLIGAILGICIGLMVAWAQIKFKLLLINPGALSPIAYPMEIRWQDVLTVFFTILTLGTIASYIGASRVNKRLISNT